MRRHKQTSDQLPIHLIVGRLKKRSHFDGGLTIARLGMLFMLTVGMTMGGLSMQPPAVKSENNAISSQCPHSSSRPRPEFAQPLDSTQTFASHTHKSNNHQHSAITLPDLGKTHLPQSPAISEWRIFRALTPDEFMTPLCLSWTVCNNRHQDCRNLPTLTLLIAFLQQMFLLASLILFQWYLVGLVGFVEA